MNEIVLFPSSTIRVNSCSFVVKIHSQPKPAAADLKNCLDHE